MKLLPGGCGIMMVEVISMARLTVDLPDELLSVIAAQSSNLSQEIRKYLAVALYAEGKLTMGSAAIVAGMSYSDFLQMVGRIGLGPCYTVQHFEEDMNTLKELDML